MRLQFAQYRVLRGGRTIAGICADVAPGEVLSVMGPSGAGKSSLLLGLAGLLPPGFATGGQVFLGGEDLLSTRPEGRRVGLMFQDALLYPHMSVLGNVLFAVPRRVEGERLARTVRRERALAALARVAMDDCAGRDPLTLSGGQKSRVALARTLAAEPRALLLDEPFSALDQTLRAATRDIVFKLARQDGLPVVMVSHDPQDAEAAGGPVIHISALPEAGDTAI